MNDTAIQCLDLITGKSVKNGGGKELSGFYWNKSQKKVSDTIENVEKQLKQLRTDVYFFQFTADKTTRKALMKQKPIKVKFEDIGYDLHNSVNVYACICPHCGLDILRFTDDDITDCDSDDPEEMFHSSLVWHGYEGRNSYCSRCGQKLMWENGTAKKKRRLQFEQEEKEHS